MDKLSVVLESIQTLLEKEDFKNDHRTSVFFLRGIERSTLLH